MPRDLLGRLPAIDLHIHLEGSLPRATLAALASRHRLPVPPLRRFEGFAGFLKAFGAVCDLLRDEDDFERATADLIARARARGVCHLEVLFSPQVFLRRGVPLDAIVRGMLRGRRAQARAAGPSVLFILDGVRQWGGEWLEQVIVAAAPWAGRGIAAVGVGGDEGAAPARRFARAFRMARRLGLRTTIHAGESEGPASIREALEHLRPDRIGHGVRAAEDADLARDLARRGVTLEICPTSNRMTGVLSGGARRAVRALIAAGVPITINSDDGAFFGTDVVRELRRARTELGLAPAEIHRATLNAARASFLPDPARRRLERRILTAASAPRG